MKISYKAGIFFLIITCLLVFTLINLINISKLAHKSENIQEQRFKFYKLVNEHKDNTDIFSNIFITYISTNSSTYKKKIDDILFKTNKKENIRTYRNKIISAFNFDPAFKITKQKEEELSLFFEKLDFSQKQFDKIFFADKIVDKILDLEFEAINASKGLIKDEKSFYTIKVASNNDYALKLILSDEYQNLKKDLNKNINSLFEEVDTYLVRYQDDLKNKEKQAYQKLKLFSILSLLFIIFSYMYVKRTLIDNLNELFIWIKQMKENDYIIKDKKFRKDEVGLIMQSFNKMAVIIHKDKEDLIKLSVTDVLTNINNRVSLDKNIKEAYYSFQRYNHPCSLILLDIDHFKDVNDNYGHLVGDSVLKKIASILQENIRLSDILGRFGGEEFLIICTNTKEEEAFLLAQKLREKIEKFSFEKVGFKTSSFGVSSFSKNITLEESLDQSDKALYQAKKEGRNRVCIYKN